MPINKKFNLTYIHIPKTGGSTIDRIFNMNKPDCLYNDNGPLSNGRSFIIDRVEFAPQHFTWDIIKERETSFYDQSIKFSFVRNPYTRIISEYFWLKKYKNFNPIDFENWVVEFLSEINNDHKLPQSKFIPEEINFLGKTETFSDDINRFIDEYNLPFKYSGEKINKTIYNKDELVEKLSSRSIELINEIYKDDFFRFDYKIKK